MRKKVIRHITDGEIGTIIHDVTQPGTIGDILMESEEKKVVKIDHDLSDGAAPPADSILPFKCTEEEKAKILGLYSYVIRALILMTSCRHIFQIPSDLKEALDWQFAHLKRVGIDLPGKVVMDESKFSLMKEPELAGSYLSAFFYGPEALDADGNIRRFEATQFFNDKNNVLRLAESLGIRTPPTAMFDSVGEVGDCGKFFVPMAIKKGVTSVAPATVKMTNSVSGLGLATSYSGEHLESILARVPTGKSFQVQKFLDGLIPYSFQWWSDGNGTAIPITGTCNFIENGANHAGNWGSHLIPHKALEVFTRPIAEAAARMGLEEWFSCDVALYEGKFYILEINPRYTGAAYPFIALMRLLGYKEAMKSFWASKTYESSIYPISNLDLGELEFRLTGSNKSGDKEGWVSVNPGPISVGDGKISMMYVGDPAKYKRSEDDLQALLAA